MRDLAEVARYNFSKKFQWKRIIGVIALNVINSYFKIPENSGNIVKENPLISWYVKNNIVFLKVVDHALMIEIFKEKEKVTKEINSHLLKLWYKAEIKWIRFFA